MTQGYVPYNPRIETLKMNVTMGLNTAKLVLEDLGLDM